VAVALVVTLAVAPSAWATSGGGKAPSPVTDLRASPGPALALEPEVRTPEALAIDHRGDLVVADTGNHRVLVVGRDGALVDEFGGYGWEADRLDTPSDICVQRGFYTYVLDEGNRRVVRYDVQGDFVDVVIPEGEAGSPVAMAVAPAGGLLIVDVDTQSVLSYSQFDERLEPVGSFGIDAGGLLAPADVAVGPGREVAVADPARQAVAVFDEFGSPLYSLSSPDTLDPLDVAFDHRGNVLVVDGAHNRIVAFPAGGGAITASLQGAEGSRLTALAVSARGELAVLDGRAGRVWLIEMVYGADKPRR
jgi:DNA-binding beta-propeller fold protein YncE